MRGDFLGVGFFVRPLPIAAVALMAVNDHYLKYQYPSWWTGKLSDFAGLFFFPLFLCALYVLAANFVTRREHWLTRRGIIAAIVITDIVFIAVKVWPEAAVVYEQVLGSLGFPSRMTLDIGDLFALSMNSVTYWYANSVQYKSNI
jgi:hypothetical protein